MQKILLFLFLGSLLSIELIAQSPPYQIPQGAKKIAFLGNSITYAGDYITFIETYMRIQYPSRKWEFVNVGLPSETVSGLTEPNHAGGRFPRPDLRERLDRILAEIQPDLVFACYGMNDGIYLPFDEERFAAFKAGIEWMNETIEAFGATLIHMTPPIYDPRKGEAYANVLDIYSDWLVSFRYTADWKVIDIHRPMNTYLAFKREADSTVTLAQDGIHPEKEGHWLMAKHILLQLGEEQVGQIEDIEEWIGEGTKENTLFQWIDQRQQLMKDAWLTHIGHTRPEMKKGTPLREAQKEANAIEKKIEGWKKHNE